MIGIKLFLKILYDVARYGQYKNYENLKRTDIFLLITLNIINTIITIPNFLLDRKVCVQQDGEDLCYINKPLNLSDETWQYLTLAVVISTTIILFILLKLTKVYRADSNSKQPPNTGIDAQNNPVKIESSDIIGSTPNDTEVVILNTTPYDRNNEPFYQTLYMRKAEKNNVNDFVNGGIGFRRSEWTRKSFKSIFTFATIIIVTILAIPFPILSLIILLPISFVFLKVTKEVVDLVYNEKRELSGYISDNGSDDLIKKFTEKVEIFFSLSFYEIYNEVKDHFIVKLSVYLAWGFLIFTIIFAIFYETLKNINIIMSIGNFLENYMMLS